MLICNVRRASGIGKGPGLFIVVNQAQQFSAEARSLLALGRCGGAINQTADQFAMPPGFLLSQHSVSLALKGLQTPRAERQIRRLCGTFEIFSVAFGAANLQSRVRHTAQHARQTCATQQTKCNCNLRDCTCTAFNYWQTSRKAVVETAGIGTASTPCVNARPVCVGCFHSAGVARMAGNQEQRTPQSDGSGCGISYALELSWLGNRLVWQCEDCGHNCHCAPAELRAVCSQCPNEWTIERIKV